MKLELPTLYKKTKTGAVQQCNISTQNGVVRVVWGAVGSDNIQVKETVCYPKNIGRSNETTADFQAEKEAKAKWEKKIKTGYVENPSGESEIKLSMKVKKYQGQEKNIIFPCYASPKLNGVNGEWRLINGELKLLSRGGEEYPILEHERDAVLQTIQALDTDSLNVELYCHGMFLEEITSAVKKHNENTPRIQSYLFELPTVKSTYTEKIKILTGHHIAIQDVEIVKLYSHQELQEYHELCVKQGYEGIVIRNACCRYEYGVRSSDAFKLKVAIDAEFKILDYSVDKNGHPVFVVNNPRGVQGKYQTFKVKPKGTTEQRVEVIEQFEEKYLHKWYTVEFESWSKYGVPLKPVGVGLRKCNEQGEPLA